jgi:hypothetical protein
MRMARDDGLSWASLGQNLDIFSHFLIDVLFELARSATESKKGPL